MKNIKLVSLLFCFLITPKFIVAQVNFYRDTIVKIIRNNTELQNGWACGFNSPVFAEIDLNGDGIMDLIGYDVQTTRLSCFLNRGIINEISYIYAPEYSNLFPTELEGWVKTFDYDFDGDMDLMTYNAGGIKVFRNDITATNGLLFSLSSNILQTNYGSLISNLYSSRVDAPAFVDIDNDGDMDVLSFYIGGSWIELNKNLAMDSLGNPNQFLFYNIYGCWGYFYKEGNANKAVLPPVPNVCPLIPANPFRNSNIEKRDGGSFIWSADLDGDGDKDFLCGDKIARNLLYVENCGNPDSAWACSTDSLFPSYDIPSLMNDVSAPQYFDVNNDGNKDLIVSNFNSLGEDFKNVLFYKNTTNNITNQFAKQSSQFLSEEMIDVGTSAHPVFFDFDNDGKKDILVSNDFYFDQGNQASRVAYYKNTSIGNDINYTWINDSLINFRSIPLIGTILTFGDLDNDQDKDLIVGDAEGKLSYFVNQATLGQPANFVFAQSNYQNIDVGNDAAPQLIDIDRDGLIDLLIGERFGNLNYYRNVGTLQNPIFSIQTSNFGGVDVKRIGSSAGYSRPLLYDNGSGYELLVGSYSGFLYQFNNIDGNLSGTFNIVDSSYQNICEKIKATIAMDDVDNDGKNDLLIGNQAGGLVLYSQNNLLSNDESKEYSQDEYFIYPNPTSIYLTIESKNGKFNKKLKYEILDFAGRKIQFGELINSETQISVLNLEKGFYVINLIQNKTFCSKKFIKL